MSDQEKDWEKGAQVKLGEVTHRFSFGFTGHAAGEMGAGQVGKDVEFVLSDSGLLVPREKKASMRVLLVTSDREQCGIREYGRMLKSALEPMGVEIVEWPHPNWLEQGPSLPPEAGSFDVVHINHHAALHASWTNARVGMLMEKVWPKTPIVVTQHDTFETCSIMRERGLERFYAASAWVMHEEVGEINYQGDGRRHFIRQGVLPAQPCLPQTKHPMLGMFGFDFPWKNFDMGVRLAAAAGWDVTIVSAGMTPERHRELQDQAKGVWVNVVSEYNAPEEVVSILASCWATAFLYQNGNSGTSGAIRLGMAARKPLVAFRCRQFRDLYTLPGIFWAQDEAGVSAFLSQVARDPVDVRIMTEMLDLTARSCSWASVAVRYKEIYARAIAALPAAH